MLLFGISQNATSQRTIATSTIHKVLTVQCTYYFQSSCLFVALLGRSPGSEMEFACENRFELSEQKKIIEIWGKRCEPLHRLISHFDWNTFTFFLFVCCSSTVNRIKNGLNQIQITNQTRWTCSPVPTDCCQFFVWKSSVRFSAPLLSARTTLQRSSALDASSEHILYILLYRHTHRL